MTDRELLQMALDALEEAQDYTSCPTYSPSMTQQCAVAAVALRARLALPEPAECDGGQCGIGGYCKQCPKTKPEPDYEAEFIKDWNEGKVRRVSDGKRMVPEREWVGLTEQEHTELAIECGCLSADWVFYGAAVEQKLKEKNT